MASSRWYPSRHPEGDESPQPTASEGTTRFVLVSASKLLQEGFTATFRRLHSEQLVCVDDPTAFLVHCECAGSPDVLIVEPAMVDTIRASLRRRGWRSRILVLWARPYTGQAQLLHAPRLCGLLRICMNGAELDLLLQDVARCRHSDAGNCGNWQACLVKKTIQRPSLPLSRRELEVFQRLGDGQKVKQIARHLSVSVKTVESHRENIKRKLELDGAMALIEAAILWRRGEYVASNDRQSAMARGVLSDDGCLDDGDILLAGRGL